MTTILGPIRKGIRRIYAEATNLDATIEVVATSASITEVDARELEKALLKVAEMASRVVLAASTTAGLVAEARETDLKGALANLNFMAERMDKVAGLDHVGLARALEAVTEPDIYELALRELSKYEHGPVRLKMLRQALDTVEAEKGGGD